MKFENTEVFNIEGAIRGMRNPLNSWDKSDSGIGCCLPFHFDFNLCRDCDLCASKLCHGGYYVIGPKDLELAKKLVKADSSERKFLRQIFVSVDITAPLYWWKETDQYKVNVTTNSQSTMHKLASTPITLDCFETGDYEGDLPVDELNDSSLTEEGKTSGFIPHWHIDEFTTKLVNRLEEFRQMYLKTKDKRYWKELVRWLPESWLQTRTWTANYEVLRNIYHQRKNHKLVEWHKFCEWIEALPYAKELIIGE